MFKNEGVKFTDKNHQDFYINTMADLKDDPYHRALVYTIGMCYDTRRNFDRIYNKRERLIKPEVINEGWLTGTSARVIRLAFQLFTDNTPTAFTHDEKGRETKNFMECQLYSVSDIFCCEYAPYFVEAVKIRYPEYFGIY